MVAMMVDVIRYEGLVMLKSKTPKWPASSNTYILPSDGEALIVDPGCGHEERAKLIESVLKKEGVKRSTVVLTHAHPDHMGAAGLMEENVLVHEIEVEYARNPRLLSDPFNVDLVRKILNIDFDLMEYFMGLCPIYPVDASQLPEKIKFGDYVIKPILTPGHSPGHVALYIKREKLLFSGDLLGEIMAWYSPGGGGVECYMESLSKLEGLNVDKVFPSHGDVTSIERVEEERRVLEERKRKILNAIEVGVKSREELGRALFGEKWSSFTNLLILESHLVKLRKDGKL
ncbi:MAG: MBL fold metallo-hydrolase [Archaeoglobus sp.]|uniref:MBL fold metallo-hydrolase n=1 Tax=Archaeoglobus sp. TaxID=1872626 RepID=UPI001DB68A88|nr:MBL fold metallo-hydrolase [Archaeoglobus sp.]MBO8180993.1 MBL fold metallo-hydrolase [Archaeoglobus sp.]